MSEPGFPQHPMEDLLAAYALHALSDEERRRVEDVLRVDPDARATVDRYREVAAMLAVSAEQPPAGLWDRIAAELEEAPPAPGPELASVLGVAVEPSTADRRSRRRSALVAIGAGLAAALIAVVVTLAITRRGEPAADTALEQAYEAALDAPQRRIADLVSPDQPFTADAVVLVDGTGYLAADALPRLSDDETWQLWGVYGDDDVISLGVLGNQPTLAPFTAEDDVVALVITREAAGGVVSSTSGAVLVGELS